MEEEQIKIFADSLWDYMLEKKLKQYLSDSVCYYIATVTEAASGGMIKVQRPYDKEVTLPCGANAEGLAVGDTCTVLVFGDFSNQIVIGDVSKLQAKLTFDNSPIDGSQNPVTSDGIFDAISAADANIAIVENGTTATHNIIAGEYVIWQGALYTADTNISSGTSISTLNLTAVAKGGANDLKSAINKGGDIESGDFALTFNGGNYTTPFTDVTSKYYKTGRVVQLVGVFKLATGASASASASYVFIDLPFANVAVCGTDTLGVAYISNNGEKLLCKANSSRLTIYLAAVFNGTTVYAQAGQTIEFTLTYITNAN